MRKRNIGERAETYFDSIDLQILEKLHTAQNINNQPHGFGVLEIANAINIKHKNLKPHIDKLLKLDLIHAYKDNNKVYLWTDKANLEYIFGNDIEIITEDQQEQEKILKEIKEKETIFDYLKKVKDLNFKESVTKVIETDFRRLRTKLPKNKPVIKKSIKNKKK